MTVIHQSATVVTVVGGFQVLLVLFGKLVASELVLKNWYRNCYPLDSVHKKP